MLSLPITTLLATGLTILLIILTARVITQRRGAHVSLGTDGDEVLTRRSRAHGNLTEYAPLFVIMTGLAEAQIATPFLIGAVAATFFIGRVLHAYALAFTAKNMQFRVVGMIMTLVALAVICVINVVTVLT